MMNAKRMMTKFFALGALAVGALMVAPPADAMTVSGFMGQAGGSDLACLGKWDSMVTNTCSRQVAVYFDVATTASPSNYSAQVYAPTEGTVSCQAQSWTYENTAFFGPTVTNGSAGSSSLSGGYWDLNLTYGGALSTANTHTILCRLDPSTNVMAVNGG
jgi:hypothetical protein